MTNCIFHHRRLFGEIHQSVMQLNSVGRLASAEWLQLPNRFENLELGEWVIMPNHFHGILINTGRGEASYSDFTVPSETLMKDASPVHLDGTTPSSLNAMIQNYKSVTSRKINNLCGKTKQSIWQRNYYEHIIRNDRELQAITDYIHTNPQNWEKDTDYRG